MAKDKKSSKDKAAARKAKNQEVQNNWQPINDMDGIKSEAMFIRNHGVILRESGTYGICSTFIPETKVKKRGVNFFLVKDTEEMRESKAEKRKANKEKKGGKTKAKK